ncbi:3518_t:CDS:1, partial [Racocetra fulgida]
ELQWQTALQNNLYTCGGPILPEDHQLYNILFVRKHISCNSPIETNYYFCEHGDRIQLCYWCKTEDGLSDLPKSLTNQYKIVYTCCNICKELEKDHFTCLDIKVGKN